MLAAHVDPQPDRGGFGRCDQREHHADHVTRTGGEIREVVRTIVTSPEFLAPESRSAKVKTPLEFVVSAVRAGGGEIDDARDLAAANRLFGG